MRLKNRKKSAAAIKSMKVGTDELKDLIKGAVKEAMGEEDDTGDDGSDTAAALDGITAEDMADIIEQAVDSANEKRKSRKDAGEEVGDLTADEVIQEAAEIIDSMTADEGMDDDEADPEGKDDDEADSDEKDDDEAASEDDAKRRKSAAFRRQVKSGTAPAQRKYSSLFMGGTASAKKQQKSVPPLVNLARAIKCLDVFGRHDPERAEFYAKKYYNDTSMAHEFKAMSATNPTAGGFLIPEVYLDEVIELLYSKTVIKELGARTIPLENGNLNIPRMTSGTRAMWGGEGRKIASTQPASGMYWAFRSRSPAATAAFRIMRRLKAAQAVSTVTAWRRTGGRQTAASTRWPWASLHRPWGSAASASTGTAVEHLSTPTPVARKQRGSAPRRASTPAPPT